jgi:hypothetical protein
LSDAFNADPRITRRHDGGVFALHNLPGPARNVDSIICLARPVDLARTLLQALVELVDGARRNGVERQLGRLVAGLRGHVLDGPHGAFVTGFGALTDFR